MTLLVILDRDGVINHDSEHYIRCAAEWVPINGSVEAIALLHRAGISVTIATNQAGIAKGVFSQADLDSIHHKLLEHITAGGGQVERIFVCTHHPDQHCSCRKPQPGMLEAACREYGVQAQSVPFVGDSLRDIQAAEAAGCRPVLVLTGNGQQTLKGKALPANLEVFDDLLDFAREFVNGSKLQGIGENLSCTAREFARKVS